MPNDDFILKPDDCILITGATGFIGSRLVESLIALGFRNLRCFARPSSKSTRIAAITRPRTDGVKIEIVTGNLLSRVDCATAVRGAEVIYHLAAGTGEKSYPDAYMNSVVTTRNLLDAAHADGSLRRFVSISSLAVYSNRDKPRRSVLDESCPLESRPELRGEAYSYAKAKQDELVSEYGQMFGIPWVILRPGYVYGPGKASISGRIGLGTFGLFLHLGGSNPIPFTFVDNCADAIALAGLKKGIEGEIFNVIDDQLYTSGKFLHLYKSHVRRFRSLYLPHAVSYGLCALWEEYSRWSKGQIDPVFNRSCWHANWKKTHYSNRKIKDQLGWTPRISMAEGLQRYMNACRSELPNA